MANSTTHQSYFKKMSGNLVLLFIDVLKYKIRHQPGIIEFLFFLEQSFGRSFQFFKEKFEFPAAFF